MHWLQLGKYYLANVVDFVAPRDYPVPYLLAIAHLTSRMLAEGHGGTYEHDTEGDAACQRTAAGMCETAPSIASDFWVGLNENHYDRRMRQCTSVGAGRVIPGRVGSPIKNSKRPNMVMTL